MKIAYYTHKGRGRGRNEDGIFLRGYSVREANAPQILHMPSGRGLFVVLDGVGGIPGGGQATDLILDSLESAHVPKNPDCGAIKQMLYQAAHFLRKTARERGELTEMSAVCAGVWLRGNSALIFNCGDCHVYLSEAGQCRQLTHDHTLSQELYDKGMIDREEMRLDSSRNILLTAISARPRKPEIFCDSVDIRKGGLFLICSDGLWSEIAFSQLREILSRGMENAASILANAARSGSDDSSFILLDCVAKEK